MGRLLGIAITALLLFAAPAYAGPLGLGDCHRTQEVFECSGMVRTWDGVPLDTTVVMPSARSRKLPLVAELHGFGNSKYEYLNPADPAYTGNAYSWARRGYAVLAYTSRGLWGSCGTPESRLAFPSGCARGYIHLADARYEVRDAQTLIGRLVDSGYVARSKIGVTGDSYGGGQSLMLAALRNRVMLRNGKLIRWKSRAGTPLRVAAAAPVIPWSDLLTAAAPNGKVTANGITGLGAATQPVGIVKSTVIEGIALAAKFAVGPGQPIGEPFTFGRPMGYLPLPSADPDADITSLVTRTRLGEPYAGPEDRALVSDITRFHSAYYIDASRKPPPLLLASGFSDDLFPVDEVLRYANRTRKRYPKSPMSLFLGDFGHQRASNEPVERRRLVKRIHRWFDHYLRGGRKRPGKGVTAYLQTCPKELPPVGPFTASTFARLAGRSITGTFPAAQTVLSVGGDPAVGNALDPVLGGGDGCVETASALAAGTARYRIRTVGDHPINILGAPQLSAHVDIQGVGPGIAQLDARLWDVAAGGETQRLIARGLYRPKQGANRWELHPAAWPAQPGHMIELELLGNDKPYARPSNGTFSLAVSNLTVKLPVR